MTGGSSSRTAATTAGCSPGSSRGTSHDAELASALYQRLARYLALTAADPGVDADTVARARRLVGATADGFWAGRAASSAGSRVPVGATEAATVDGRLELSTQLQAWMTLEAAAALG